MVMSVMREKTKVVLFVALLAFVGLIFFDWGMQKSGSGRGRGPQDNSIGTVNGRGITPQDYRSMRQSVVGSFEARTGRSPEIADYEGVEEETWLALVRQSLLAEEIERHDIRITDAEVLEVLRTNPPQFLRAEPVFQDENGKFDPVRYSRALADPSFNWVGAEMAIRTLLPGDKLQNYVGMDAHVTAGEVREAFIARNEKVRVAYVRSAPAGIDVPNDATSDDALRSYFESHRDDFLAGERAVLEIVAVSKTPSADDTAAARTDLGDVRGQIVGGADFSNTAVTWSDDTSASRGGDLGFIRRGEMVPEFESVAFATPAGQVSEVFESPFGFHVLKVEEIKTEGGVETRRVRHILMRIEASNTTLRIAGQKIDDFLGSLEAGEDFAHAAAAEELEITRTAPFERGAAIEGIGLLPGASRFAFSRKVGDVTLTPIEDERSIYAFRLVQRLAPGPLPFDDVRDRVVELVAEKQRREIARNRLADAIAASGGGSLGPIAEALGVAVDTTSEFSRESFVPGAGRRNAFVAAAFALEVGALSDVIETDRGFHVLEVLERIPADETQLAEQRDGIQRSLLERKRQTLITAWIENLLAEAKVVDYRSGVGVDWKPDPGLFQYAGK